MYESELYIYRLIVTVLEPGRHTFGIFRWPMALGLWLDLVCIDVADPWARLRLGRFGGRIRWIRRRGSLGREWPVNVDRVIGVVGGCQYQAFHLFLGGFLLIEVGEKGRFCW